MADRLDEANDLLETATSDPTTVDLDTAEELLDADEDTVRNVTLKALAATANEEPDRVVPLSESVIEALDDPFPIARSMAAVVLMMIAKDCPENVRPAIPMLIDNLDDDIPLHRFRAAGALGALSDATPEAFVEHSDELFDFLVDGPKIETDAALPSGDPLGGGAPKPLSIKEDTIVREQEQERRYSQSAREMTASILVEVAKADPGACACRLSDLITLSNDNTAPIRATALEIVTYIAEDDPAAIEPAIEALLDRLDDDTKFVRMWAIEALGTAGVSEAIDPLYEIADTASDEDLAEFATETADSLTKMD